MVERAVAGLVVATSVGWTAWRGGSLSPSGAIAAAILGTLCVAAGWPWAALLLVFFLSSSALTKWRGAAKAARSGGIVEKGGARDAVQVLANGGLFAVAGFLGVWQASACIQSFGLGSLAAATSDTWGTEIGMALRASPRFILTGRRVAAGTSGAISGAGSLASLAGAGAIGGAVWLCGWSPVVAIATASAGVAGAFADTLLGATLQERRRCPRCQLSTERLVHECGSATNRVGGISGLRNDLVNLASGALGGLTAAAVHWALA